MQTREETPIPVVVLGATGSGKSTLINYLLGKPMKQEKIAGLNCIDVAEGRSNPVIGHLDLSVTKKNDTFESQDHSILYTDTPRTENRFKNDARTAIKNAHDNHGVAIVVIESSTLISIPHNSRLLDDLKDDLKFLTDETDLLSMPILFVLTKATGSYQQVDKADIATIVEGFPADRNEFPLLVKMEDPNNWVPIDMLTHNNRDEIVSWIKTASCKQSHDMKKDMQMPPLTQTKMNFFASGDSKDQAGLEIPNKEADQSYREQVNLKN